MTNNGTYDYSYYNPYYNTSSSYYPYGGYNYSNVTYSLNSTNTANATYAPSRTTAPTVPTTTTTPLPLATTTAPGATTATAPPGTTHGAALGATPGATTATALPGTTLPLGVHGTTRGATTEAGGHNNSWYNNSMNNWTWNQWDNSEDCINPLFMEGIFESEGCSCDVQKWSQSLMWKSPRNCKIFAQGCNKYEVTRDQKIRSCTERSYCEYYDNRPKCIQYHENKWSWESGASQLVASAAVAVAALSTIY
eukprot:CAMPEP_0170487214 /NCGR_PEP_ID=MMETSP0208-20121228/6076_1 /TAXON_ID=197538 /ORGANISM="Strombidium inclinatum, Strain S3" /LENGTH=250 /DNA_ID=CAMNT_0010761431 /DNA_START=114 /DNA_END=866 /DNA_ORIENTATION=+